MLGDKGLTESVVEELNRALNDHELIKVKVVAEDREARAALIAELSETTGAEVVQTIGKIALLSRKLQSKTRSYPILSVLPIFLTKYRIYGQLRTQRI